MTIEEIILDNAKILLENMDYGTAQLFLKKHDGGVTSLDAVKQTSYKTNGGNIEALQIVNALLKALIDSHATGSTTFTVSFEMGNANRVIVQDFKRIKLN